MKTLIKNGTLITASETFEADILIEGEKILSILSSDSEVSRLRNSFYSFAYGFRRSISS